MKALKKLWIMLLVVILAGSVVACNSSSNTDQSGAQQNQGEQSGNAGAFYEGKTVEIIVPFSAGGGTDALFRFMQKYLVKGIEGNPTIQVVNIPGGGSIIGANEYVDMRKPDGLTLLATSASTKIPFLIGDPQVHYDLRKLEPIVGAPDGVVLYTSPDSGIKEGKDLLNPPKELVLGATSPTGIDVMTLLALEVLGIKDKIKIIFGYEGAGASRQAFLQGETNLDYQSGTSFQSNVVPLVKEGKVIPLFTYGFIGAGGDLIRDPAFPDIPTVKEVYMDMYGKEPSGQAWEAYKAFVGVVNGLHKALWVHGDAPEEAIKALKEGAAKAVQDPEFIAQKDSVIGSYQPLVGEALESAIQALVNINDDTLKWVSDYLTNEYGVEGLNR